MGWDGVLWDGVGVVWCRVVWYGGEMGWVSGWATMCAITWV